MATSSAAKAHRQSLKHRLRNRMVRSATKTIVKNAEAVIAAGDPEAARLAVRAAISKLDRAAKKGVVHANAAVAALQAPPPDEEKPKRRQARSAESAKPKASRAKKAKK